jgi:hypothetical protein
MGLGQRSSHCCWQCKPQRIKTGQVQSAEQMEGAFNPDGSIRFSPARDRVKTQIKFETKNNKDFNQKNSSQVKF